MSTTENDSLKGLRASTKSALKAATRAWEHDQQRFVQTEDHLAAKCRFVEEIARLYQEECQYLLENQKTAAVEIERGMSRDVDVMIDRNRTLSFELRKLQEALQLAVKEKEAAVLKTTQDFQRLASRASERHKLQLSNMQQERDALEGRVAVLQATVDEQKALRASEQVVETAEIQYAIDDLTVQVHDEHEAMLREQNDRLRLEEELTLTRHQLKRANQFLSSMAPTIDRISTMFDRCQSHHAALVDDVLRAVSDGSNNDATTATQREATVVRRGGDATASSRSLASRPDPSAHVAPSAVGAAEEFIGAVGDAHSPALSKSDALATVNRFTHVIKRLESMLEAQQVELALAVRCANEMYHQYVSESRGKLTSAYAHCQLLLARLQELERNLADARDHAQAERDKALNQRDQALLQLRSREARERKVVRHVETQTIASKIDGKANHHVSASVLDAGSVATGGGITSAMMQKGNALSRVTEKSDSAK